MTTDPIEELRKRAVAAGLRADSDAPPPTQEELEAYVKEVEKSYLSKEEQDLALQAQADLAEGERLARDQARRTIKAQRRAFKGIYNRTHFIIWAKQTLRRAQLAQEREIEEAERNG